jgi:hypothetical protein
MFMGQDIFGDRVDLFLREIESPSLFIQAHCVIPPLGGCCLETRRE